MRKYRWHILVLFPFIILTIGLFFQPRLMEKFSSDYGDVYVYSYYSGHLMTFSPLSKNPIHQSLISLNHPLELKHSYAQAMVHGLRYLKSPSSLLMVGLGGGIISNYLHHHFPNMILDVVEINPAVVHAAKKYFHVKEDDHYHIFMDDGRTFLKNTLLHYDVIMLDGFGETSIPMQLATQEFYQLVREHLRPKGVAIQNLHPNHPSYPYILHTIQHIFDHVEFEYADHNVIVFAYQGQKKSDAWIANNHNDVSMQVQKTYIPTHPRQEPPHVEFPILRDGIPSPWHTQHP